MLAPPVAVAVSLLMSPAPTLPNDDTLDLEPCPATPNCVSTRAERDSQRMDPIPFSGSLDEARSRLVDLLEAEPRVRLEAVDRHRIVSVFTTRLMRFKDDVVFVLDPEERVIHFRSASRVGRSDWGANRDRMERLTRAFLASEAESP